MFSLSLVVHRGEASRKAPCGFLFNWVKDEESSSRLSSQRPRHRCGGTAPAATPPRGGLASPLWWWPRALRAQAHFLGRVNLSFFHDLCPDRKNNWSRIYSRFKAPAINSITFSWLLGRGRYASLFSLLSCICDWISFRKRDFLHSTAAAKRWKSKITHVPQSLTRALYKITQKFVRFTVFA